MLATNLPLEKDKAQREKDAAAFMPRISTISSVKSVKSVLSVVDMAEVRPPNAGWESQLEFLLTCISYAVGLGNVWRFPYLCFSNGGGAFVLPYCIMLVLIGLPVFFLELSFGQFAGLGPLMIWNFCPLMKGLGFGMITVTLIISLYYNVIIAQCLFYFYHSIKSVFDNEAPWMTCGNSWNTPDCFVADTKRPGVHLNGSATVEFDPPNTTNASCIVSTNKTLEGVDGFAGTSTEEFFYNNVLHKSPHGITDFGWPELEMSIFLLVCWVIVCAGLIKGVSSLGKISYFTAIFPYCMLIVLLVRGLTLEGSFEGIKFYFSADWSRLAQPKVWQEAATQIFYNLSCATGGLMAMASFNKFNNNCLRDALLVPILNAGTSVFAGLVVFCILGVMAFEKGVPVEEVVAGGPGLVFIAYPEALAKLPYPSAWAIAFFLMMLSLGFGSELSLVESVLTAFQDDWHDVINSKAKSIIYRVFACFLFFLIGLSMVTKFGIYILEIVDYYVSFIALIVLCLLEVVVIAWVYGFPEYRVCEDIKMMLDREPPMFYKIMWRYVTPAVLFILIVASAASYSPFLMTIAEECKEIYPDWAYVLGWFIALVPLVFTPIWIVWYGMKLRGEHKNDPNVSNLTVNEFLTHFQPQVNWGPREEEYRSGRYQFMTQAIMEANVDNNFPSVDALIDMQKHSKNNDYITSGDYESAEPMMSKRV